MRLGLFLNFKNFFRTNRFFGFKCLAFGLFCMLGFFGGINGKEHWFFPGWESVYRPGLRGFCFGVAGAVKIQPTPSSNLLTMASFKRRFAV